MTSIYVEQRVGSLAIGYTYFPDTNEWQIKEQVGENRCAEYIDSDVIPDVIKKAVKIMLEEGE